MAQPLPQAVSETKQVANSVSLLTRVARRCSRPMLDHLGAWLKLRAATSSWAAGLYYCVTSKEFRLEQRAFLNGERMYDALLASPTAEFGMLRRNTHRLEKGLLMRPRRKVFAKQYIEETVDCYVQLAISCCESDDSPDSGLVWSRDVLTEFFAITDDDPVLNACREKFVLAPSIAICDDGRRLVPYKRDFSTCPTINVADFHVLALHRRSVRWFLDQQVERDKIDQAIQIAGLAPSACNRQPFVFRIFDDPEKVQRIAALPMGTGGYQQNIPVIMVIVGQQRNYFSERDRHLIYIDSSLAAMSFIFAAETQGLSTCCINWPDVAHLETKMARELDLEADERPIMCMAVGYPDPDGMVAYSQKKSLDRLRRYN